MADIMELISKIKKMLFKEVSRSEKKEEKISLEQVFSEQSPEFMENIITSAQMFKEQKSKLYKRELLNPQKLDFSIESVTEIEKYLDIVKMDEIDEQKMDEVCFQCGVYLGEVIRRNTKDNITYWLNLESASKLDKSIADYEVTFALSAILANKKTLMYPINKILKYLFDKENNGLKFYATVSVKISSLTESSFGEGRSP